MFGELRIRGPEFHVLNTLVFSTVVCKTGVKDTSFSTYTQIGMHWTRGW
jgi:hypothetical protein